MCIRDSRHLDERADSPEPVDAVFASNDNYAALALGWARARAIRVPEDFQVIGYDGTQSEMCIRDRE